MGGQRLSGGASLYGRRAECFAAFLPQKLSQKDRGQSLLYLGERAGRTLLEERHLLDRRPRESKNNEPYLFRIPVDPVGIPCPLAPIPPLNSKHGDNYTHKRTWEEYVPAELRGGKPYNYYPRGRVEIKDKGKTKIFLNPDIATEEIIAYIVEKFRLQHREVKAIADGSKHYHCAEKDKV